jgi:hypothetical protein
MGHKHVSLLYKFLSMLMVIFVTTQCVAAPASVGTTPGSKPSTTGETTLPQATLSSEPAATNVIEENTPVDLNAIPYLGSSTFTVDSSTRAEGEYKADGTELQLQLTDPAGYTWTLVIPDMALPAPEKISMTSLKDITSQEIVGNLISGVQLEPDGLQFILPARLSISGPASQGTMILLGGNQDGSQTSFLIPDPAAEGASALIYHFSSAMGDELDDSTIPSMLKAAMAAYNEAAKQAKQLLKEPLSTPTPPSSKLRCMDKEEGEQAGKQFDEFLSAFNSPEMAVISSMLSAARNIELLGGEATDLSLINRVQQRLVTKASNLINTYGNQIDYLPAITSVTLQSLRNQELLGGGDDATTQKLSSQLAAMWKKAIDVLLKELVEQHEYRNVTAIVNAARNATLLGSEDIDLGKILEKIRKAMHFDLELKSTLTVASVHHWILEANFPVQVKSDIEVTKLSGDGTGNLSSYVYDGAPEYSATAPAFSVNAEFTEFYACEGTAKFSVDQFFPASETVTVADPEDPRTISQNITQLGWETHFGDRLIDGRYTFEVTINNNAENAVDQSFTQVYGPNETIFEVKLKHTPQK